MKIQDFILQKQNKVAIIFHESNLLSYLCWLTHLGLNVSAPTFKSCDQYIFETDARNRESVCGLPEWSTVMRTDVLYKDC